MRSNKFSDVVSDFVQTPDCRDRREKEWSGIVIHHTANVAQDLEGWRRIAEGVKNWLTYKDQNYVSAHFEISREGHILQICDPEKYEAFHAGVSEHWNQNLRRVVTDWNRHAIGIELVGDGNKVPYSPSQYFSLIKLTRELLQRYPSIHIKNIVGHDEIAPERKNDPGMLFDWVNFLREVCLSNS